MQPRKPIWIRVDPDTLEARATHEREQAISICEARERCGLTQAQAAAEVGITPVSWNRYENEVKIPKVDVALRMAKLLHVDVKNLFQI